MLEEYFEYGEHIQDATIEAFKIKKAQEMLKACEANIAFSIVELRKKNEGENYVEIIVVDCFNDKVPTQNKIGIQYKERLALIFPSDDLRLPEVRGLRKNFPDTPHQNLVENGEPKSFCLYGESWSRVVREWTPQKHLKKILWWLEQASLENLHHPDQPVERFYHDSLWKIILSVDFFRKVMQEKLNFILFHIRSKKNINIFRAIFYKDKSEIPNNSLACIVLDVAPVVHGKIENYPFSLGQLHDQFQIKNTEFQTKLRLSVKDVITNRDERKTDIYHQNVFLILHIPIKRSLKGDIELFDRRGFIIHSTLVDLGVSFGDFEMQNNKIATLLKSTVSEKWRDIKISPVDIIEDFSPELAKEISSVENDKFSGVLIGVGAIGSGLINIWGRNGWGKWTLIDDDYIQPHNISRHLAFNSHVGLCKVDAIKNIMQCIFNEKTDDLKTINDNFYNDKNIEILNAIISSKLVVDASAALEVSRDLSLIENERAVSVFLTPSGQAAIMLFEDRFKKINLISLEAQYYRAILTRSWGENHLTGYVSNMRFGGGCRDLSSKISNEFVQLHIANLARHVRLHQNKEHAKIQIWHIDSETGSVSTDVIQPEISLHTQVGEWKIVWDSEIQNKLKTLRSQMLPNETGGILLGYIDQKIKCIIIVDALPAPIDSISDKEGFIRGIQHVKAAVSSAQEKTAGIVSYIGEWHSHPTGTSTNPSDLDNKLIDALSKQLYEDGAPGVILIIGENNENWIIKDANK